MAISRMLQAAGRPALQLGRGIDTSTGAACGVAVVPDQDRVATDDSGQQVFYSVEQLQTTEELQKSLGIFAGADLRYGLFSAEGKFNLQNQSQFKMAVHHR